VAPRELEEDNSEELCRFCVPRRSGEVRADSPPPGAELEKEWDIEHSIFAPYEESLGRRPFCEKCFETDWFLSNCYWLIPDDSDREQVKDLLRAHYAEIKVLYASLCSVEHRLAQETADSRQRPLIFGMGLNEYTHMLVQHHLIGEDSLLSLEDADAIFIAAAAPTKESLASERSAQTGGCCILRHSFFELLIRIAGKCFRPKTNTLYHALEILLNKHIMYPYTPMKNNIKCVSWRSDALHSKEVDEVFQRHCRELLGPLFHAYSSGAGPRPGLPPEGWFALLDALNVLPCDGEDGLMNTWDRVWLWQISAMTRTDELTRQWELVFVEFLEALGRLVGLLRSRQMVAAASSEVAERSGWDYGLGTPSASTVFCVDKEGVMYSDAFAEHSMPSSKVLRRSGPWRRD